MALIYDDDIDRKFDRKMVIFNDCLVIGGQFLGKRKKPIE